MKKEKRQKATKQSHTHNFYCYIDWPYLAVQLQKRAKSCVVSGVIQSRYRTMAMLQWTNAFFYIKLLNTQHSGEADRQREGVWRLQTR